MIMILILIPEPSRSSNCACNTLEALHHCFFNLRKVDYVVTSRFDVVLTKEAGASAPCRFTAPAPAKCCVCMEFAAKDSRDTVRLPRSHSLHRGCIMPWFYEVTTCPMCRHDMGKYLIAVTNTPKGKVPGLGP
jgi:hypothetical protein